MALVFSPPLFSLSVSRLPSQLFSSLSSTTPQLSYPSLLSLLSQLLSSLLSSLSSSLPSSPLLHSSPILLSFFPAPPETE